MSIRSRSRTLFAIALCCVLWSASALSAQCVLSYAWTASESDNVLRRVALDGMTVEETITIDVPGQIITGVTGIAIEPSTGNLYVLAYFDTNPNVPFLLKYDVVNSFTEVLGSTFVNFIALEFQPNGELNAISGDTASPINSFCILSLLTGAPTDICLFGNGDDGEAIGYHPTEARMYHASGRLNVVLEASTAGGPNPCTVDSIPLDTVLTGSEVTGLAFVPGENAFLWTQAGIATSDFYFVTTAGVATFVGTANHSVSDVAIFELATPCPPGQEFVRGDANGDSGVNIADAIFLLGQLFVPNAQSSTCADSTDFNDDGSVNIADAIYLLNGLFTPTGSDPPAPFPTCGQDPTSDGLDCDIYFCP